MLELFRHTGAFLFSGGMVLPATGALRAVLVVAGSGVALFDNVGMVEVNPGRVLLVVEEVELKFSGPLESAVELRFDRVMLEGFLFRHPRARGLDLFTGRIFLDLGDDRVGSVLDELELLSADIGRGVGLERLQLWFSLVMMAMVEGELVVSPVPVEVGRSDLRSEFSVLLEQNFRSVRATRFYARKLAVSSRRLNELCRSWYGMNMFEVLMDRICSEAEEMLVSSDVPVKAVAYDLGFSSTQHFRFYFKRFRGMSPTEFRERSSTDRSM